MEDIMIDYELNLSRNIEWISLRAEQFKNHSILLDQAAI